MQIFEGEYLQAEKKQVADVYSCKLIEKSICKSSKQADADTTVLKKVSARAFNKLM